jgi:ABC-type polysaccharide/polyol phosphate export permease
VPGPVYDSAAPPPTPLGAAHAAWRSRSLLRVLVARDLAVRYKRSVLGVWWTLLNPLLEMAVFWVVFSQVFRFAIPGIPYSLYVLSGLVVFTSFRQTVIGCAGATLNHADLLRKVRVEPAMFSLSTAGANLVTFCVTLVPLAIGMVIAGVAPSPAALLAVPLVVALGATAFGLGLALSPLVARFPDTADLLAIVLTLVGYLAPVFYPAEVVPDQYEIVQKLNPLYHFVTLFRELLFGSGVGSATSWAVVIGSAVVSLTLAHVVYRALRRGTFAVL